MEILRRVDLPAVDLNPFAQESIQMKTSTDFGGLQEINLDGIPDEIKKLRRWVNWRYGKCNRNGKPTKPPINAHNGELASCHDPDTWASFEEAVKGIELWRAKRVKGIGFQLGDGFAGVDLDRCENADGLKPESQKVIDDLDSNTEWSPSLEGIHILVKGELPADDRRKGAGIEMYDFRAILHHDGLARQGHPADHQRAAQGTPRSPCPYLRAGQVIHHLAPALATERCRCRDHR
jgi:primase-polymerase (primpol)-like protein